MAAVAALEAGTTPASQARQQQEQQYTVEGMHFPTEGAGQLMGMQPWTGTPPKEGVGEHVPQLAPSGIGNLGATWPPQGSKREPGMGRLVGVEGSTWV